MTNKAIAPLRIRRGASMSAVRDRLDSSEKIAI
jgi:hypothetical protein